MKLDINEQNWARLLGEIVATKFVERMQRVADACNQQAGLVDGYRVGIQGDSGKTLQKHDLRMTVITATAEAIEDNARHNRLLANFHLAGGE